MTVTAAVAIVSIQSSAVDARAASRSLPESTHFYVPGFETAARQQRTSLIEQGDRHDASLLAAMEQTSHGVWVTGGSPDAARAEVQGTADRAAAKGQVPVFVAYDIPGRDCGGLSAGGALNSAQYDAWIDGFARGVGDHRAVVILEPDALGLLPSNCGGASSTYPFTDADRYAELNYAVNRLEQHPDVSVYLDGTHSGWLNVGVAANRLVNAGVQRAQGFFLDVSNFQFTANLQEYGTWISDCVAYATRVKRGDYGACPDQYWNGGGPGGGNGVALSPYGVWSDTATAQDLDTAGENARYASMLGTTKPSTHFVIDTSRNGRGPWNFPAGTYPDPQDWCNPPLRGLGIRPTANTGHRLVDAYVWIKVPGESDGSCNRGAGGSSVDPVWAASTGDPSFVDPAAGQWFPQQALQLAQQASPPL